MDTILTLEAVTKQFGQRTVLQGVDLAVPSGSATAIVGKSGSGKSTLLNIIGLLDSPTSGIVKLAGKPLPPINSRAAMLLRRHSINYLFQSFALLPSETVRNNILLGMRYATGPKKQQEAQIAEMLERLELSHLIDQRVMTLSGGEQQRVALARCLLKPGELILADEPTGALDAKLAAKSLTEMLQMQHEFGKTLVIVTHDPTVAAACDAVLTLPSD